MPEVLMDFLGYSFFFWSNEGAEPPHIHVSRGKPSSNSTKFWITKDGIQLVHNDAKLSSRELKKVARYILDNRDHVLAAWVDYFI